MEQPLFRKQVLDAPSREWLGSVQLATPISDQIWAAIAVSIAVAIVIWLFTGHYTRRVHVTGILVPKAGLITVSASSAGVVENVSVSEGGHVRKATPLILISGEHTSRSLGATSASVTVQLQREAASLVQDIKDMQSLESQQTQDNQLQQAMLRGQIDQLNAQLEIESHQIAMAQELVLKWRPLLAKGYVSTLQFEQEQSQVWSDQSQYKSLVQQRYVTRQQLSALNDQLAQLPLTTSAKLNELQRQLAQIQQTLAQNEATRDSVLYPPAAGMVSSLLAKVGDTVAVGQPLLSIVPDGTTLEAQVLVPSQAIGFVHPGVGVVLHYQAFPYQKFGLQKGTVLTVSRSALSPNEVTQLLGGAQPQPASPDPYYRVQIALNAQTIHTDARTESLKPGMALDADMLLERRRMIEWIFEPLLSMGYWAKTS